MPFDECRSCGGLTRGVRLRQPSDSRGDCMAYVIKRYSNRKLYETQESRVTSEEIEEMIRGGKISVVDASTGEDFTLARSRRSSQRTSATGAPCSRLPSSTSSCSTARRGSTSCSARCARASRASSEPARVGDACRVESDAVRGGAAEESRAWTPRGRRAGLSNAPLRSLFPLDAGMHRDPWNVGDVEDRGLQEKLEPSEHRQGREHDSAGRRQAVVGDTHDPLRGAERCPADRQRASEDEKQRAGGEVLDEVTPEDATSERSPEAAREGGEDVHGAEPLSSSP